MEVFWGRFFEYQAAISLTLGLWHCRLLFLRPTAKTPLWSKQHKEASVEERDMTL